MSTPSKIIHGIRKELIQLAVHLTICSITFRYHKNLLNVYQILKSLVSIRRKVLGYHKIYKVAKVDGRYYWDLYAPGYYSASFTRYIEGEINRIAPIPSPANRFTNIFLAITKKCALKCEHCFEWEVLNKKEGLSLSHLKKIVNEFQTMGTALIQLTGGEPMVRVNDIVEVLRSSKLETDFWVLTSGMNLSVENAKQLKEAGLTGVVISLDHFDGDLHNQFRGHLKSFEWVESAVKNSIRANLVTALSICATKSFVTEGNLLAYAELAKKWGVSFIQILEPRAVGHYYGMDVQLGREQENILENFYFKMNCEKKYSNYPIVVYHGHHQRHVGCFSSGNRNLYVDTDGDIHACPFCRQKTGNALSGNLEQSLSVLQTAGCHAFKTYTD